MSLLPWLVPVQETMTIKEKRRLNSRVPISRLPPEVLSLIFSNTRDDHLAALKEGFDLPLDDDVGSELWKDFTHVCHRWREIALCTPTLWTRIISSPNNNKWTQEMLLRSKRCLLTCIIEGCLDSCDSSNGRTELIKQLGRCHTLSMRKIPRQDLHRYWSQKVDAPHLEFLVIHVNEGDASSDVPFILSDSHLHAPSLRSLEIENCSVDWESGFLTSRLTQLALYGLPVDCRLACSEFIKVLGKMPLLEEIYLSFDYMRDEDADDPPLSDSLPTCLHWPHLRRLEILDDIVNVARFLNNITLPPMSELHLKTCNLMHEGPYVPLVLEWVSNHFKQLAGDGAPRLAPQNCLRSFLVLELGNEFMIEGFKELLHPDQEGEAHALLQFQFVDFKNDNPNSHIIRETLVNMFLPHLPISSIVFLDVEIWSFYLTASCWSTIFGSIPTLESIRLSNPQPMTFFHALRPDSSNAHFPALKSIMFSHEIQTDYPAVVEILRERAEVGMRLLEFIFLIHIDSIPPYHALSQLMEVVPKVGIYHGEVDEVDESD